MKRFIKWAGLGFAIYLLWPYEVFTLARANPRTTALIELRRQQAAEAGRKLKPQMQWRALRDISPNLVHAVLLAEDDVFYQHHGFDFQQIRIALAENIAKGRYAYGGSTITQQLARTLYLRPRKSLLRKLKEAVLTVYLEALLPKKRILEIYLNVAEWGPGIYGAEAASQYYFWKPAADLTPDESVALASVLPSPRRWSPFSEKAYMAKRRMQLTARMQKAGYAPVTFSDGEEAGQFPLDLDAVPGLPEPVISTKPIVQPAAPASDSDTLAIPDRTDAPINP